MNKVFNLMSNLLMILNCFPRLPEESRTISRLVLTFRTPGISGSDPSLLVNIADNTDNSCDNPQCILTSTVLTLPQPNYTLPELTNCELCECDV